MNLPDLCIASNNANKIIELKSMLSDFYNVKSMAEIGCFDEIEETGTTFEENSRIKAEHIFKKFGIATLSDDSGLEVEALGNRPGVYSARFAGEPTNHENNMAKVLEDLAGSENRKACFRTVITLILEGKVSCFEGKVSGKILEEKIGTDGFGYDPIFVPDGYSETFAQMSVKQKSEMSHRGEAIKKLVAFIKG